MGPNLITYSRTVFADDFQLATIPHGLGAAWPAAVGHGLACDDRGDGGGI